MTELILALAVAVPLAFWAGFYLREVRKSLQGIIHRLEALKKAQAEAKPPSVGFAEPMTMDELREMESDERIKLLNE